MEICKLCMENSGPFFNIFSDQVIATRIKNSLPFPVVNYEEMSSNLAYGLQKFVELFPNWRSRNLVNEYDDLPHKICFQCLGKVEELHDFVQKCVTAQGNHSRLIPTTVSTVNNLEEKLHLSNMIKDKTFKDDKKKNLESITILNKNDGDNSNLKNKNEKHVSNQKVEQPKQNERNLFNGKVKPPKPKEPEKSPVEVNTSQYERITVKCGDTYIYAWKQVQKEPTHPPLPPQSILPNVARLPGTIKVPCTSMQNSVKPTQKNREKLLAEVKQTRHPFYITRQICNTEASYAVETKKKNNEVVGSRLIRLEPTHPPLPPNIPRLTRSIKVLLIPRKNISSKNIQLSNLVKLPSLDAPQTQSTTTKRKSDDAVSVIPSQVAQPKRQREPKSVIKKTASDHEKTPSEYIIDLTDNHATKPSEDIIDLTDNHATKPSKGIIDLTDNHATKPSKDIIDLTDDHATKPSEDIIDLTDEPKN